MKNWEPLVSLPRLAMDSKKGLSCFRRRFSSERGKEGKQREEGLTNGSRLVPGGLPLKADVE